MPENAQLGNRNRFKYFVVMVVATTVFSSTMKSSSHLSQIQTITKPLPSDQTPAISFLSSKNSSNFRPVTSLASRSNCKPFSNQPLVKVDSFTGFTDASSTFWDDNDVLSRSGHTKDPFVSVCEFLTSKDHSTHFAHTMQQLYGCFSYWQEPKYSDTRHILVLSSKIQKKIQKNPFVNGFLEVLTSQIHLEIMTKHHFLQEFNNTNAPVSIDISGGYILKHASVLNRLVQNHYNLSTNLDACSEVTPRIAILNRVKPVGRSIINAPKLVELLSTSSFLNQSLGNNNILVDYFEQKSFSEQVLFFQNVDILIAPHGAQLTGLPFLNGRCSQLLELFPKEYAIPSFFGSLALQSHSSYSYLYLSDRSWEVEQAENLLNRIHARATNLCPNPQVIVNSVRMLVADWKACCRGSGGS